MTAVAQLPSALPDQARPVRDLGPTTAGMFTSPTAALRDEIVMLRGGRPLCSEDRELLATFLEVFVLLLERTGTRERSAPHYPEPAPTDATHRWGRSTNHLADLTARQVEVLAAMATGASNAEIAASLFVSTTTVKSHVRRILGTLQVPNRGGAIAHYLRHTMNGPTRDR